MEFLTPIRATPIARRLRLRQVGHWLGAVTMAGALALVAPAGASEPDVAAVKTAFVYNFAKFTNWPPEAGADSRIVFCVRRDALEPDALAALRGKILQERPVEVRLFDALPPAMPCHVIYVSESADDKVDTLVELSRNHPVLTVSDLPGFSDMGGHITLFEENGRMRFKVNLEAARRSRLDLSSKLLQLATVVGDER